MLARNLALAGNHQQIDELADAMELLPRYAKLPKKYPQSAYRYREVLEGREEAPDRY